MYDTRHVLVTVTGNKALRSAGGIRRPLRLLRKEKQCEAEKGKSMLVQTGDLKMPRAPPPCSRKTTHRHTHE